MVHRRSDPGIGIEHSADRVRFGPKRRPLGVHAHAERVPETFAPNLTALSTLRSYVAGITRHTSGAAVITGNAYPTSLIWCARRQPSDAEAHRDV